MRSADYDPRHFDTRVEADTKGELGKEEKAMCGLLSQ